MPNFINEDRDVSKKYSLPSPHLSQNAIITKKINIKPGKEVSHTLLVVV